MTNMLRERFLPGASSAGLVAALALSAALTASPARADRCDDLASQLKNQIDGLRVGQTAAGVIYLAPTRSSPGPIASRRRPSSISLPAHRRSSSPCRRTTCSRAPRAA
jgi:hypothetical protein